MIEVNNAPSVIVGLGNPGFEYRYNRHNIGFQVLDALAERYNGQWRSRADALVSSVIINNSPVVLIKPQTFMNSSGEAITHIVRKGSFDVTRLLVVHDELELPFGRIALKKGGSHRGHNGLRSIIAVCGDTFTRLRFGIGRPDDKSVVPAYVLSNFNADESKQIDNLVQQSVSHIEHLFDNK